MKFSLRLIVLALIMLWGGAGAAFAEDFPTKPIRVIVCFPAGGLHDTIARLIGTQLSARLGQPVVVDIVPGAGGTIGASTVARAKPDGHTLLVGSISNIAMAPAQYKSLPYDPVSGFVPVSRIGVVTNILTVNPTLPVRSFGEFVALAKQKPGSISFGSPGMGTSGHLMIEMLKNMAGIDLVQVPYKGEAPIAVDLVAGQIPVAFLTPLQAMPFIKADRLRPIALSTAQRSALVPGVPSIAEMGLPEFDVGIWLGIFAPAGTPSDIVGKLNAHIAEIVQIPAIRQKLADFGAEPPVTSTPEQFSVFIKSEVTKWNKLAKEAGITPQ
ncbi:MAG: hypothetical protein K0R53_2287 [Burkholderiales bacterium]|jgi:tripartite-type tricarboxylate transporter receptor subunit TctC|nr:hypothetical protein [Burkholderiales bacterium]